MKKIVITALMALAAFAAWGQQAVVAVMPFEVRDQVVTAQDAANFTTYFSNELASMRILRLSPRTDVDAAIKKEFANQQRDWSDPNKTARVGDVLNADWMVIGVASKSGSQIMLNISLFEVNTREQVPVVTGFAANVDAAYAAINGMSDTFVERIFAAVKRAARELQNFEMSVNGNSITIIEYKGQGGSVTIPRSINGRTVTSIGDEAFEYCSELSSVTIPNSVTSIGDGAFEGCSGLSSVTIPNSVTSIGDGAFLGCSGLKAISVSPINRQYKDIDGVLFTKDGKILTSYPAGKIQTAYTIPNSVTSIGVGAFRGCSGLSSVTIPNSVTSIGDGAFRGCSGLSSVTIPNSVTSIGDEAFEYCSELSSVTIPNSVTSIGAWAFQGCSGLSSVTIPNSVTSIGYWAFRGCSGLSSITIPNSVTSIGREAFSECYSLNKTSRDAIERRFGSSVFDSGRMHTRGPYF
jgi:TolB-like protein